MTHRLTAKDVLKRYMDEDLPEFCELRLVDINQRGNFGNCPIHVASVRGNVLELQALLEEGADIDALGELGNTALHEAVGQGHAAIVKMLLAAGASTSGKNKLGITPKEIAEMKGNREVLELLKTSE